MKQDAKQGWSAWVEYDTAMSGALKEYRYAEDGRKKGREDEIFDLFSNSNPAWPCSSEGELRERLAHIHGVDVTT